MKGREINELEIFNHEDYRYIYKYHHAGITLLGKKLDRQHFQRFSDIKIPRLRNPRRKIYKYNNKIYNLHELSQISGYNYNTLHSRIHGYGMDIDRAMTQPLKNKLGYTQ